MPSGTRLPIILLTAAYLVAEVAFNAGLFRLLAGAPSLDDLETYKLYGRLLAATGFALLIFKFITRQILIVGLAATGFYFAEQAIVDRLVDSVDGELRHRAVVAETAIRAHAEGRGHIAGLPLPETLSDRAQSALLAIVPPAVALSGIDLKPFRPAYEAAMMRELRIDNIDKLWRDYSAGVAKLKTAYALYSGDKAAAREDAIDAAWREYRATVPANRGIYRQREIVSNLRSRGIMVGTNFHPDDRGAFERAVGLKFDADTAAAVSLDLPQGLTFVQYASRPEIAAKLQGLPPNLDRRAFTEIVKSRALLTVVSPPPAAYVDGDLREVGQAAALRLVVPTLGLMLSAVFGLVNFLHLLAMLLPILRGGAATSAVDYTIASTATACVAGAMLLLGGRALGELPIWPTLAVESGALAWILQLQAGIGALV
jgi:hypothetical protein